MKVGKRQGTQPGGRRILLGPYPPPYGGVANYLAALVAALDEKKTPFELVIASTVHRDGPHLRQDRRQVWGRFKGCGAADVCLDLSGFFLEYLLPLALIPWLVLKRWKGFRWVKVILDGTLEGRYRGFGPLHRFWFRLALSQVDEFVVASPQTRNWLVGAQGVGVDVHVIPCLLPLSPEEVARAKAFRPPAWFKGRKTWVCGIGVFTEPYGFDHVARAVEAIRRESGKDVGLLLLDGRFSRDEAYRTETLRNRGWIKVLEMVPRPEVLGYLRRSRVFVRSFSQDSYGISRVEALWCGVPVVATRSGETRGMSLYDYGDVEGLTRTLRGALAGDGNAQVGPWARRYEREARANLRRILDLL